MAAANPVGGHYNKSKTVTENLKMNPALLSRFDLVFILIDKPDESVGKFEKSVKKWQFLVMYEYVFYTVSLVKSQNAFLANYILEKCYFGKDWFENCL